MGVKAYTRSEAKDLFRGYLWDVVNDPLVHGHLVSMLERMIFGKEDKKFISPPRKVDSLPITDKFNESSIEDTFLPIREITPDSIKNHALFTKGKYHELVQRGDGYLFLCGFFPEYTSKQRRSSPGMDFYIKKGKDCYFYACNLAEYYQYGDAEPSVVMRLLNTFTDNINALLVLRERFQECEILFDPIVYDDLKKHTGFEGSIDWRIFVQEGYKNCREHLNSINIDQKLQDTTKTTSDIPLENTLDSSEPKISSIYGHLRVVK